MARLVPLLLGVVVVLAVLPAPAGANVVRRGLAFGAAENVRGERQVLRLDLYRPDGRRRGQRSPAIVWIHGGGFTRGDRALMRPYAARFARRGYVAATIDYRLAERAGLFTKERTRAMLDAQHDAQAAVRWLRRRAATFGIDPSRIVVAGQSAGAMTALNVAMHAGDPGESGNPGPSSRVSAAVSIAGYAPEPRFDAATPPLLLLHGTADRTVPFRYGRRTCRQARAAGARCDLVAYRGADHDISRRRIPALSARALRWLERRVAKVVARSAARRVRVEPKLRYGSSITERGRRKSLYLDLYRPRSRVPPEGRRAIIWVHGGGFRSGHRRLMRGYARRSAQRGDVAATIDYRLWSRTSLYGPGRSVAERAAQHDTQAAVRFMRAQAERLGVDRSRIYVGGGSAGAITALNVAMHANDPGESGTPQHPSDVRGAISIAGFASDPRFDGTPPLLVLHGTKDKLIHYWRARRTCREARAARVRCDLIAYRGAGHPMIGRKVDRISRRAHGWMTRVERGLREPGARSG